MYKEKAITERKLQAGSSGSLLEKDTVIQEKAVL